MLMRQAHHGGEEPLRPTRLYVCNRLFGFVCGEIDVAMTRQGGEADERMDQCVVLVSLAFRLGARPGNERHDRGQDLAILATTADIGELRLYVVVKAFHLVRRLLDGEDHVGPTSRECLAAPRRPGLDDDRACLGRGRDVEGTA